MFPQANQEAKHAAQMKVNALPFSIAAIRYRPVLHSSRCTSATKSVTVAGSGSIARYHEEADAESLCEREEFLRVARLLHIR